MHLGLPDGTLVSHKNQLLLLLVCSRAVLHTGSKPTSASSESKVPLAEGSMPWQTEASSKEDFKYQYHPGGDKSKAPKEAPSALNVVIVPNVNLPKVIIS